MMTSYRGFPLVLCYAVLSGFLRHPVQAAVVTCNVTTKDLGQHLGLKFRLNVDIGKEHLSFTIQRSDLNEPIQHDDDTPLVCKWDKSVHLNCQLSSGAYSFNRSVGRELILEIVNVTEESEGMYRIQVFQEKSVHVETCTLIPLGSGGTEVNTSPVTPYTSSTSGKAHVSEETTREPEDGDGNGKIVGAVVGPLLAVVVITIIIIIILKRRRQRNQENDGLINRNPSSNCPVQDSPGGANSPQHIAATGTASASVLGSDPQNKPKVEDDGHPGKSCLNETRPQEENPTREEEKAADIHSPKQQLHVPPIKGEPVESPENDVPEEGGFNDDKSSQEQGGFVRRRIKEFEGIGPGEQENKKRKHANSDTAENARNEHDTEHQSGNSCKDEHAPLLEQNDVDKKA